MSSPWRVVSLALKAAMAALLLFALLHPDWGRFSDKGMGTRAIAYPVAALLVPAVWAIRRRRYAWDVDALIVAPFVIDLAGNAANLYDTVSWFDDACHFANWALLGAAAGALMRRLPSIAPWLLALACAGIGAIAAILWEIAEYLVFILNTPETVGIYRDTIGDEALGLSGATLAGVLTALVAARQRSAAHRELATGEL